MGKINWRRVIPGGLLAGLIFNVIELTEGFILVDRWVAALERFGIGPDDPVAVALGICSMFLYGFFSVWLYAAIRPRFGPGPRTAARAGFAAWFVGFFVGGLGFASIKVLPVGLLAIWVTIGLGEVILGTLAGAWLYKES